MAKENNKNNKTHRESRRLARFEDLSPRDLFSKFFDHDLWLEPFGSWRLPRMLSRIGERWFPRVDISETDTEVKVVADVPGVDPDDVDIDVRDSRMIIKGYTERESETEKGVRPYRYERSYGEFRRDIMLPSPVKEDQVKATYKDGVLTITLPKVDQEKKNRIKIEKQ